MDALKSLAGQQGCSADGTAASRNPLSKLINKIGADGRQSGPRGPKHLNEIGMRLIASHNF